MGREIRMVPKDWVHPTDGRGQLIPLHESSYEERLAEWNEGKAQWAKGLREDWAKSTETKKAWKPLEEDEKGQTWVEWDGKKPVKKDYMPTFKPGTATCLRMYETCTEGTPISPAFETPEELAHWLADNGASSFGACTATYEQWLATCKSGFAPSAVYSPQTGLISGVEANLLEK